jgi:hypothetical protein
LFQWRSQGRLQSSDGTSAAVKAILASFHDELCRLSIDFCLRHCRYKVAVKDLIFCEVCSSFEKVLRGYPLCHLHSSMGQVFKAIFVNLPGSDRAVWPKRLKNKVTNIARHQALNHGALIMSLTLCMPRMCCLLVNSSNSNAEDMIKIFK